MHRTQPKMAQQCIETTPLAKYWYTPKDCMGGDCRVGGNSPLVRCNHSYWVCAHCSLNGQLTVLATTCAIGDVNKAPTSSVRKEFIAKGGNITHQRRPQLV